MIGTQNCKNMISLEMVEELSGSSSHLKLYRDFQDLQVSMESLVFQETQVSQDLQAIQATLG